MRRSSIPLMINSREDFECRHETRFALAVEDHDAGDVAAAVAVVGGTPDGHEVLVKVVFVAFHDELMSSCDQREIVDVIELSLIPEPKRGARGGSDTSRATLSPNNQPAPRGETAHVWISTPSITIQSWTCGGASYHRGHSTLNRKRRPRGGSLVHGQ
jgi:hypothetical protein